MVIPGAERSEGSPEPMNTDLWKMGSRLAAEPVLGPRGARTRGRRLGMTRNWRFTHDRLPGGEGKFLTIIHSAAEIP